MVVNKSDIARKSGISRQQVIKILSKKVKNPKILTLQKIAQVMGCKVEELGYQIE